MNGTRVSSYGEIILNESLIDLVKPCHKKKYVAIFDLVPTMEDFNIKVFEFSKNTCGKGVWHNQFFDGIHESKLKYWYRDIRQSLCVCTWISFGRCLHALGGFWHLQIVERSWVTKFRCFIMFCFRLVN